MVVVVAVIVVMVVLVFLVVIDVVLSKLELRARGGGEKLIIVNGFVLLRYFSKQGSNFVHVLSGLAPATAASSWKPSWARDKNRIGSSKKSQHDFTKNR